MAFPTARRRFAICAGAILAGMGAPPPGVAEQALPNPMLQQNPMTPNPGRPMSPMSISPMQPLGGLAGQPEAAVVRDPEFDNLPVGPGMEETFYSCTGCHSSQTFQQMRLTDARWEYLWTWMIEEQGMPDYGDETRVVILDYLQEHFSVVSGNWWKFSNGDLRAW